MEGEDGGGVVEAVAGEVLEGAGGVAGEGLEAAGGVAGEGRQGAGGLALAERSHPGEWGGGIADVRRFGR